MTLKSRLMLALFGITGLLALASCAPEEAVSSASVAQTVSVDPVWERSTERHGDAWWGTAVHELTKYSPALGTYVDCLKFTEPDVTHYGADPTPWTWNVPTADTWPVTSGGASWFYTVEGPSTANSWFRTTLAARAGMRLVRFTLTSADKPAQGIGINDGIYVFLDGGFTGQWASVAVYWSAFVDPPSCGIFDVTPPTCYLDWRFPTGWRTDDLTVEVGDAAPQDHEIAVAFEEDSGWGGLTRLRVVAEYEDIDADDDGVVDADDQCPQTAAGAAVDQSGCSIAQLCPCAGEWKNHGAHVSCVAGAADAFLAAGLISQAEHDATVSAAARSACGKKSK